MDRALEMQVFCAVVDKGSFVGAVDALEMSKAAVSRHVNALEERLGVRLLQRTTRRLSLTEEGRVFYQQAREVLALMGEAESAVSSGNHEPAGVLRVNAPVSFGVLHLAPLWTAFLEQNPKIELDISLNDRQVDLVEEGYDVAVRIARLESSSLVGRRFASTRMRLCAAPSYIKSHAPVEVPQDLAEHRVIAYSNFSSGNEWSFTGPDGEHKVNTRSVIRCNNGDTCRSIALTAGGILLQPSFMVSEDLRRGDLVELLPEYRSVELGIYAVYPTRKHLASKVQAFINFLVEQFEQVDWESGYPAQKSQARAAKKM
ncbi:LysR family transcriptional regulator [Pseudomonas aeruginosa]|uniref:LysR family transcriptional regulator n=1 Tax=Pseudomonas aeruginosa TaxID=287 RepID=UPI0029354225|nr:LysR family transcriptional regulator [Pseudomonas aeruginosa]MDV2726445.1 LysR family transcriptional regulator [Pseudomonas aeruginosa]